MPTGLFYSWLVLLIKQFFQPIVELALYVFW
ncbi:hypothetical protein SAMN06265337_2306 [Hymenobacter gelipurpurascens]|uniref:Uncharacterized protein n=1 Tax=Hymenobacter gelipurpurascens TaxID=89968 RepID=A0A212TRC9_9BACT|nr:hypothetical protein SAMN06265337_2306 [Hymenobacter gelipurpurascens]